MSAVPDVVGRGVWILAVLLSRHCNRGPGEFFNPLINFVHALWEEVEDQTSQGTTGPIDQGYVDRILQ